MKKAELQMEDYLYAFYQKIGRQVDKSPEQVMTDALFRFAGEAALQVMGKKGRGQICICPHPFIA